jgi:hypothetical protein
MVVQTRYLNFSAGQVEICRNHGKTFEPGWNDFLFDIRVTDQSLVDALSGGAFQTEATGSVPLRIKVNQKYPFPFRRKTGRQVHGSGCLADTAFLVCDCEQLH